MLSGESFGDAGVTVVLEERIAGAEVSAHAICDGERVLMLPPAQDHKRIGDGDSGPNTGGMGTYAPPPLVDAGARAAHPARDPRAGGQRVWRPTACLFAARCLRA